MKDHNEEFKERAYKIGMKNGWCSGKYGFEDGSYTVEEDRLNKNSFTIFTDLEELKKTFLEGNWCLGQAFIYKNLCFINQVNAGDEWLTIKNFEDEAIHFESISMIPTIRDEEFEELIERLSKANKEDCLSLTY